MGQNNYPNQKNIRLTNEDQLLLSELCVMLNQPNESELIRQLIREKHKEEKLK